MNRLEPVYRGRSARLGFERGYPEEEVMQNRIALLLSGLVGILWVLTGLLHWPIWIGVVASMLIGLYWAFGRDIFEPERRRRVRDRDRDGGR